MDVQTHIAIPACDEEEYLPRVLDVLCRQTNLTFQVWVCINQPETWWDKEDTRLICEHNQRLLGYVKKIQAELPFKLRILDCSSRGRGWLVEHAGASLARKTLMDRIIDESDLHAIILSLDADTMINDNYVEEALEMFERFPLASAVAFPYYHVLEGDEMMQKAMIRYETYLRNYFLKLLEIQSPYAYVPIGSAFAVRVWAYKAVRGMPLVAAGEDFYFLQKVRQVGFIIPSWAPVVYPSGRLSRRVLFGTGRALSYSFNELCQRYPLFPDHAFRKIRQVYDEIQSISLTRILNDATNLLTYVSRKKVLAIIKNFKQPHHIEHALHIQFNALQIYHALKDELGTYDESDAFLDLLRKTGLLQFAPDLWESSIDQLEIFRRRLFEMELNFVKKKLKAISEKNKSWWKYLTCW